MTTIYKSKVNVEISGGSYRIRFTYHGQRKCFGTGIKVGLPEAQDAAIAIAKQIEIGMLRGIFNGDIEKYKPERYQKPVLTLVQEFDQFLAVKQLETRLSTFSQKYAYHADYARRILGKFKAIDDVTTNYCISELATLKKRLKWNSVKCKVLPLILFWDWMQADVDIPVNPWRKALKRLKVDEIEKPEPFTKDERDAIISAMLEHGDLRLWVPLTRFLMATGCRPGEAFALTFKDIKQLEGYLVIDKSAVNRDVGKTKTGKARRVPLTEAIRVALEGAVGDRAMYDNDLCFPHPQTGNILTSNIFLQYWKKALLLAGVPYRKPYANRHTWATEALLQGGNPVEVAKILGNSPKVIYQHYLNVTGDTSKSMPNI